MRQPFRNEKSKSAVGLFPRPVAQRTKGHIIRARRPVNQVLCRSERSVMHSQQSPGAWACITLGGRLTLVVCWCQPCTSGGGKILRR